MAASRLSAAACAVALAFAAARAAQAGPGRAAMLQDIRVESTVDGDVIALRGDVVLTRDAHVTGDAIAIWGTVRMEPGAQVDGRVIGVSSLASMTLDPRCEPRVAGSLRLLFSGFWLALTSALALLFPGRLRHGVWALKVMRGKVIALGLMVTITMFAALVAALSLGPGLGAALAAVVMVGFFVGRVVGLTVIGNWLGALVLRRALRYSPAPTFDVFVGVALLLALRFVPIVGGGLWTLLSVAAVGAGVFAIVLAPEGDPVHIPVRSAGPPQG